MTRDYLGYSNPRATRGDKGTCRATTEVGCRSAQDLFATVILRTRRRRSPHINNTWKRRLFAKNEAVLDQESDDSKDAPGDRSRTEGKPALISMHQDGVPSVHDRTVQSLIKAFSVERGVLFGSCLDIGCGRSRYDRWFGKFDRAADPKRYVGVETDEDIIAELRAEHVDMRTPDDLDDEKFDLTLAIEVIEHISEAETQPFLRSVRDRTNGVLALTTPNIEYWRVGGTGPENRNVASFRQLIGYEELRWIPDHTPIYDPASNDSHVHKQLFTPASLRAALVEAFTPADGWEVVVYRAWPWRIADLTRPQFEYDVYFKLYALAWNLDFVEAL